MIKRDNFNKTKLEISVVYEWTAERTRESTLA